MTSEKMRWVHDCTHTKGHKMYGDPVERSLGHWFAACPHCAKPNPYHEKPTPPASHDAGKAVRYGNMTVSLEVNGTLYVEAAKYTAHMQALTAEVSRLTGENATHLNDWRGQVQKTCAALKQRNDALDELERRTQQFSTVVGRLQKKGIGLTADLERSRQECERLREAALATAGMYGRDCRESMLRAFEQAAALSAGEK